MENLLPDKLTTTEFLIVKELAKRPGIIKERAQLMDIAYKEDTEIEDRTIDSHVKRIRKKFKKVDKIFLQLKQDMVVGIGGMLVNVEYFFKKFINTKKIFIY